MFRHNYKTHRLANQWPWQNLKPLRMIPAKNEHKLNITKQTPFPSYRLVSHHKHPSLLDALCLLSGWSFRQKKKHRNPVVEYIVPSSWGQKNIEQFTMIDYLWFNALKLPSTSINYSTDPASKKRNLFFFRSTRSNSTGARGDRLLVRLARARTSRPRRSPAAAPHPLPRPPGTPRPEGRASGHSDTNLGSIREIRSAPKHVKYLR